MLNLSSVLSAAGGETVTTTAAGAGGGSANSWISTVILIVAMVAVFYFLIIRPQKKRDKQAREMRSSIKVGDEIVTIGGIIGIIVSMKEDSLVIETGSDRSKVRLARWAISGKNTTAEPK